MVTIYEHLDFILNIKNVSVQQYEGEWCFIHHVAGWNNFIHGEKPYTRDEAYADALAFVLGLPMIADNATQ